MTMLVRWDPFRQMNVLRGELDRRFDEPFLRTPSLWQREGVAFSLALDVAEDDQEYTVKASLPGVARASRVVVSVTLPSGGARRLALRAWGPPIITWPWASTKPGRRTRPPRSIIPALGPRWRITSARLPTARIRRPAAAIASARLALSFMARAGMVWGGLGGGSVGMLTNQGARVTGPAEALADLFGQRGGLASATPGLGAQIAAAGRTTALARGRRLFSAGDPPGGISGVLAGALGARGARPSTCPGPPAAARSCAVARALARPRSGAGRGRAGDGFCRAGAGTVCGRPGGSPGAATMSGCSTCRRWRVLPMAGRARGDETVARRPETGDRGPETRKVNSVARVGNFCGPLRR